MFILKYIKYLKDSNLIKKVRHTKWDKRSNICRNSLSFYGWNETYLRHYKVEKIVSMNFSYVSASCSVSCLKIETCPKHDWIACNDPPSLKKTIFLCFPSLAHFTYKTRLDTMLTLLRLYVIINTCYLWDHEVMQGTHNYIKEIEQHLYVS